MLEASITRHECPYCGYVTAESVYIHDEMSIYYGQTVCPECGAMMVPIYKNVINE